MVLLMIQMVARAPGDNGGGAAMRVTSTEEPAFGSGYPDRGIIQQQPRFVPNYLHNSTANISSHIAAAAAVVVDGGMYNRGTRIANNVCVEPVLCNFYNAEKCLK